MTKKKPPGPIANYFDPDAPDVDEWVDDPDDDALDELEEEVAEIAEEIVERQKKELALLWAESARVPLKDLDEQEELLGRSAVQKIVKLGQRCAAKGPLQKALKKYCGLRNIPKLKMVKRVATRWNTMFNVVDRALKLRKALESLCCSSTMNIGRPPSKRLKRFNLTSEEWKILENMLPVLKVSFASFFTYLANYSFAASQ